jgi:hypothetical protein
MEQEEPRVRLQAYGDVIQAELLLNQGQDTLVTAFVDTNLAKVSVDLRVLSRIIESISSSSEDQDEADSENSESSDFELQMSGVISLEMNTENPTQAIFSAHVDQAIQVIG